MQSAGIPGPLGTCLTDLVAHCKQLYEENQKLYMANQEFEAKLIVQSPFCPVRDGMGEIEAVERYKVQGGSCGTTVRSANAGVERDDVPATEGKYLIPSGIQSGSHESMEGAVGPHAGGPRSSTTLASSRIAILRQHHTVSTDEPRRSLSHTHSLRNMVETLRQSMVAAKEVDKHYVRRMTQSVARHVVDHIVFKVVCAVAVFSNVVYIGISADKQVKHNYRKVLCVDYEEEPVVPDIMFLVWFTFELLVRCAAERKAFFNGKEWKWNAFDGVLVLSQAFELIVDQEISLSFLRVFRVVRLVRVVRIVRALTFLRALRTMIFSVLNCTVSLMWALLMITLVVLVFAIIFTGAVSGYFYTLDTTDPQAVKDAAEVNQYFGTLYRAMCSLYSAITGGNDWMLYAEVLRKIHDRDIWYILFFLYVGFCSVGILNVVTGIFVDSAVMTRTEDEIVQTWRDEQRSITEEVKQIFYDADVDCSGTMSLEELVAQLEHPRVRAYFAGLNIDPDEVTIIFTLMDVDEDGAVNIDEFVDGTMKLKGAAKSVDMLALMFDQARFAVKFNRLCSYVEDGIRELKTTVNPDIPLAPRVFPTLESFALPKPKTPCYLSKPQETRSLDSKKSNNSKISDSSLQIVPFTPG